MSNVLESVSKVRSAAAIVAETSAGVKEGHFESLKKLLEEKRKVNDDLRA